MQLLWVAFVLTGAFVLKVQAQKKVVCYYESWAVYRQGSGKFDVANIDPFLCTHLIFGFAGLDPNTYKIKALDPLHDPEADGRGIKGAYRRFNDLRRQNPAMKTLISVGGRNEGSVTYSKMAASPQRRRIFIDSVVALLNRHPFNGLDFYWEFPGSRGGNEQIDKANFVLLLKELRDEFDQHGWLLTAAVAAGKATIDKAYDVPGITKYLDFISVLAYDFHGAWENTTGHHSPLNARPSESERYHQLTVNYSIHYWLSKGASRDQLVLGMALFGRSFKLANKNQYDSGSPSKEPASGGPYMKEPGTLGYNEICARPLWKLVRDTYYQAPFNYHNLDWVSFDDMESLKVKCEFANSLGLGGGMIWSLSTDDFRGSCRGNKFPLTKTIKSVLNPDISTVPPVTVTVTPESKPIPSSVATTPFVPTPTLGCTKTNTAPPVTVTVTPSESKITSSSLSITSSVPKPTRDCPSEGFHRNRYDCSKFYACAVKDGKLFVIDHLQCAPGGLLFDEVTKMCLWASDVDCNL